MKYEKEFEAWWADGARAKLLIGIVEAEAAAPGIVDDYRTIFRNAMLQTEDKIQQDVASELGTILKMIPKVADPEDINTIKITRMLQEFIDEASEEVDYVDDISELGVSDEDLEE